MRAKSDLHFSLPPVKFRLVSSLDTTHKIWVRLKELDSGDVDQTHPIQTTLPLKFRSFKQNLDERIDQLTNIFNHLLSRMLK